MIRILRLILALLVLLAVTLLVQRWSPTTGAPDAASTARDALDRTFTTLPESLTGATLSVGLLLLGSWLFGRIFKTLQLPKLSGYLIFGMIIGPQVLGVVPKDQIIHLKLVESLAISLIALTAGGEIELSFLRKAMRLILSVSIIQIIAVLVGVTVVVYALAPSIGLADAPETRIIAAIIAGTIATAASPAVFIAVMNELRAEGNSIQAALSVMISKDLALIVLFTVVIAVANGMLGGQNAPSGEGMAAASAQVADSDESNEAEPALTEQTEPAEGEATKPSGVVGTLSVHLLGSVLAGAIFGLGFAWYMHVVRAHLAIFVVAGCMSIALVSELLHLEALIVALVAGLLMRNVWRERVGPFFHTMEDLSLPVYCVFFAVAGAKLDLNALASLWPAALALVGVRAAAIWVSTDIACRLVKQGPPIRTWLWTAFVPQAGVSVALISIVQTTFAGKPFADPLYSLVLAAIGIHELIGPLLLKFGLQRLSAGEDSPEDASDEPPNQHVPS